MTRRAADPQPGMTAAWSGDCYRCGDPILRGVSRIIFNRGRALHVECASGGPRDE